MQLFAHTASRLAAVTFITLVFAGNACAHVLLLGPNGGQQIQAGTTVIVSWEILASHDTQNWDLWYSTTGDNGPWIPIALNLPAGVIAEGTVHTHQWTIPATPSSQCRVRVRQDNSGTDWEDISDSDFTIAPATTIPEGSKLTDGVPLAGTISDVYASDDQYFELDPSPTTNPLKQKVHLILLTSISTESPTSLSIRLESAMIGGPSGDVIQKIGLLNYNTGVLELVDVRPAATSDDSIEITPGGDVSRFVQPLSKEITAGITWLSEDFSGTPFTWSVDIDEAVFVITN